MKSRILIFTVLLAAVPLSGQAQTVVVPNANTATPGNADNRFPFLVNGGQRYQQVYAASEFSALSGPTLITQMALRPGPLVHTAFTTTLPDIQIDLSTISVGPDALSSTFASNIGANDTVVYSRGALTLSSTDTPGLFDIIVNFTTPFLYDPTAGNLLLDVHNFGGASSFVGTEYFDAQNTLGDGVSRVYGAEGAPSATDGNPDSLGLITQFTYGANAVPEPGNVAAFAAVGMAGILSFRRRARR